MPQVHGPNDWPMRYPETVTLVSFPRMSSWWIAGSMKAANYHITAASPADRRHHSAKPRRRTDASPGSFTKSSTPAGLDLTAPVTHYFAADSGQLRLAGGHRR
jgi:hypothetical protein